MEYFMRSSDIYIYRSSIDNISLHTSIIYNNMIHHLVIHFPQLQVGKHVSPQLPHFWGIQTISFLSDIGA